VISKPLETSYDVGQQEISVAYNKPVLDSNSYVQNDWKPIINTYSNNPYNYGPPPPPPSSSNNPGLNQNSSPLKPSYSRKPAYKPSYNGHLRRPVQFLGTRKRPQKPYQRWQDNYKTNYKRFSLKNLFG
jgi:hypothetical protein